MYRPLLISAALALLAVQPASAEDRPLTDDERAKVAAAMQAEGCSGGGMEFDDGRFEVNDARCTDGRSYDLVFDSAFKLVRKQRDED